MAAGIINKNILVDSSMFTIDENILAGASPLHEMHEQLLKEIREKLARGIPVTLTLDGRKLTTYWPNGTVEDHRPWW